MSRNILFDFGYVLTGPQEPSVFDPLLTELRLGRVAFLDAWGAWRKGFDSGELEPHAYWIKVLSHAGAGEPERVVAERFEELMRVDLSAWMRPRKAMHALVADLLEAGTQVGILSNMPPGGGAKWMAAWPWLDAVPHKLWSGDEGLAKPDAAIYRLFLERARWRPEDTLFVDDMRANVDAAISLGFATHHFVAEDAALQAVRAWASGLQVES